MLGLYRIIKMKWFICGMIFKQLINFIKCRSNCIIRVKVIYRNLNILTVHLEFCWCPGREKNQDIKRNILIRIFFFLHKDRDQQLFWCIFETVTMFTLRVMWTFRMLWVWHCEVQIFPSLLPCVWTWIKRWECRTWIDNTWVWISPSSWLCDFESLPSVNGNNSDMVVGFQRASVSENVSTESSFSQS